MYLDAFYGLNADMQAKLHGRAVFTEETDTQAFSFLVGDLATHPVVEAIPALGHFALAPIQNTPFILDPIRTFVSAVIALARLGAPLPADPPNTDSTGMIWRQARHI